MAERRLAMISPVEFLTARLDEDVAVAQAAGGDLPEWEYADHVGAMQIQTVGVSGTLGYEQHIAITRDYEGLTDSVDEDAGPHIARWDPHRVLAECEAKRAIVALHTPTFRDSKYATCDVCLDYMDVFQGLDVPEMHRYPCSTLRSLIALYAEHPDYQLVQW